MHFVTVDAYVLNPVFAAHRLDRYEPWTVTHRRTGWYAGKTKTFTLARRLASALVRAVPAKHWRFTDPQTVRHNPTFAECKALVRRYGAP